MMPRSIRLREGRQASDRKYRAVGYKADADGGRGIHRRGNRFHRPQTQSKHPVVLLFQPDTDACLDASKTCFRRADQARSVPRRHGGTGRLVGEPVKKLDDLGVADNTIVVFTTDNGAEVMSWPDGGATPFRGEKATNWEGGYRAPAVIRWPGTIRPGTVYNEMFSHYDLIPTFAAAGGDPDIVNKCMRGAQIGNKTVKVHLDGFNLIPFFKGQEKEAPRKEFVYWNDDGRLSQFVFSIGRLSSLSRITRASAYGPGNSPTCAYRSCSTCAPIRSNVATNPSSTTNGWRTAPSCRFRCRRRPPNGCRASRYFRCGRSLRASTSTR